MNLRMKFNVQCTSGLTLLELMISSTIFILLGLMTLPSFHAYSRLQEEKKLHLFKQALYYAKIHAAQSGRTTVVCPSHNQHSCSQTWSSPYIIASYGDPQENPTIFWKQSLNLLNAQSSDQSACIRFHSQGWCLTPQTIQYQGAKQVQTLVIALSGRIRSFTTKI